MKIMQIVQRVLGVTAIMGATVAIGVTAEARSIGAFAGAATTVSQASCFVNVSGGVQNKNCTTTAQWCMPLVVDDNGPHPVQIAVRAVGSNTNNIGCFSDSFDQYGNLYQSSEGLYYPPQTNQEELMAVPPGGLSTPAGGTLMACCDVGPMASIQSVNW
jgi:hypothetical protein